MPDDRSKRNPTEGPVPRADRLPSDRCVHPRLEMEDESDWYTDIPPGAGLNARRRRIGHPTVHAPEDGRRRQEGRRGRSGEGAATSKFAASMDYQRLSRSITLGVLRLDDLLIVARHGDSLLTDLAEDLVF